MEVSANNQLLQIWAVASLLGLIPAYIAYRKGRSFGLWWIYGAMIFIVAFFHSLLIKPLVKPAPPLEESVVEDLEPPLPEGTKPCFFCGQLIDELAQKCPVCKGVQPT